MLILAIETATSRQSVAVVKDAHVLAQFHCEAGRSHTATLVPAIRDLLASQSLHVGDCDAFAVSIGPGSFTGLRVGLATVSAFRLVTDIPVVPVPTLEAMAWNLHNAALPICPVLRARTGEVYWAVFQWINNQLAQVVEDQVGTVASMAASIQEPTMVFGDGVVANQHELTERLGVLHCNVPGEAMVTSAVSLASAAGPRFRDGKIGEPGMAPRYIQLPAAVRNAKK
ncbi:MAG: tRNA (adenosine(37)-N6)-threonylcarbamoyltransferase complex dimerization subunit type 1 TsaB [Nitrospirales bacterium]|nr:tRNA (adenosine(37)-N6)-threonylcarbamoyltransferase complex dimerization subunit type 1 TsaB [Nitrospirales bacterium]